MILDVLANEYGWTVDYIFSLPKKTVLKMLKVIGNRYERINKANNSRNEPTISKHDSITNDQKLNELGMLKVRQRRT